VGTFTPGVLSIDVGSAELGVVRWRGESGTPLIVAAHAITASAWSWSAVARVLAGRATLVAVDLRGRGLSHDAPGPFGLRQHADDVAAVVRRLNASPCVVAGHGMGAFVALAAAERHPDDVADVVLVDGGVPAPKVGHPGTDADPPSAPELARLGRVWPDRVSYRSTWADHPAFADLWTPEVERYVLSGLDECEGGFRCRVVEAAARENDRELTTDDDLRGLLARRLAPARIVRAENGIDGAPPPSIGDDEVGRFGRHRWTTVAGTNHYSVLLGDAGAAAIAEELLAAAT
jgi:pimeloyl-ACP methyl ester carboxylesterase